MTTAKSTATDFLDPFAAPLFWAGLWAQSAAELAKTAIPAWMALATAGAAATQTWATLAGQLIDTGRTEALSLTREADKALADELAAVEGAAQHLAFAAEEVVIGLAGPLVPLPE
jgi:hypothetical protein